MQKLIISLIIVSSFSNCNTEKSKEFKTELKYVNLPKRGNYLLFNNFAQNNVEYFSYLTDSKIYTINISKKEIADSFDLSSFSKIFLPLGDVSSYCFNGKDSLFLLLNDGICFFENKKLKKIIPINNADTVQYSTFRFSTIDGTQIYFNKQTHQIIGSVYNIEYAPQNKKYFNQKTIGKISLENNKIQLCNFSYPAKYKTNYYGFAENIYLTNFGNINYINYQSSDSFYVLDIVSNSIKSYFGKSTYQTRDILPVNLSDSESTEIKLRHLATEPLYTQIRYDGVTKKLYRIFEQEQELKTKSGKYNARDNKTKYLQVFDSTFTLISEIKLESGDNTYISFAGTKGLYIRNRSNTYQNEDSIRFKVLNLLNENKNE